MHVPPTVNLLRAIKLRQGQRQRQRQRHRPRQRQGQDESERGHTKSMPTCFCPGPTVPTAGWGVTMEGRVSRRVLIRKSKGTLPCKQREKEIRWWDEGVGVGVKTSNLAFFWSTFYRLSPSGVGQQSCGGVTRDSSLIDPPFTICIAPASRPGAYVQQSAPASQEDSKKARLCVFAFDLDCHNRKYTGMCPS